MRTLNEQDKNNYKNIWTLAEFSDGTARPVTYELLGVARRLAGERGSEVWTIVPGDTDEKDIKNIFAYGADKVVAVEDFGSSGFNDELECNMLERLVKKYLPETFLFAATSRGRALAPRLASKLYSGLTADCTGLMTDPESGDLLQTRPAFGGNIMATIKCSEHRPQMATVRPKVMPVPEPDHGRTGTVIREKTVPEDSLGIKEIFKTIKRSEPTLDISDARIIVAGGRAMKGPEGFKMLEELASRIGGAVGASRAAVDNGWISYPHQVGQTGTTVQTDLYIACGISGQIQHLIGMQSCKTIIAIDLDDTTPMMKLADIAVKGDVFEIIPKLIKMLDERKYNKGERS